MTRKFNPSPALRDLATIMRPEDAEQPILAKPVRDALHQWMTEIRAEKELRAVGVPARRSAILSGPPGCGKTTLAHHLAARLGLALVSVNLDAVRGMYIGETGKNLSAAFTALEGQSDLCILFLDELDAVASKRSSDDSSGSREMNSVVNGLLQRMESFRGMLIGATNRAAVIDPAVWRRFGLHLDIALPGEDERFAIITRYLSPFTLPEEAIGMLADATEGAAPSLLRQLMEGVKRDLILSPRLSRETGAAAVFERLIAMVRPHPDYTPPPLWTDFNTKARIAEAMTWPPTPPDAPETA
ncbi:MAG: AAA family ATPase [Alphaproteobacteria bacterium]|nr:AAA family ATPase [Alphaproteobacteria bacterium]